MGAAQAKPDLRMHRQLREELQQNEPLRKTIPGTDRSMSEQMQWGPWQGQDGDKPLPTSAADAEEEFRRRTSSVNSADIDPNWWHSSGQQKEYQREVIRKHSAHADVDIPRHWWFPNTTNESAVQNSAVAETRG
ncbi:uncharacterized protein LOC129602657 [Paramacrobiotus metropolitanus]|uniref:uncharacterized protein LOC129602657 n=1 Tax=Paramacrobiotus metropolitanus TaxID=2943436 RepID=UPI002446043F|nr:uncharacterized protein LOC129602657 [Paramacrobiotus metropolitanus]